MNVEEDPEAYMARVMSEIDDEVRRRRVSGDFPPSFERRLDVLFERFTPVGARDGHFKETLKQADRHAYMDIDVPIASDKPAARYVKSGMRTLMAWYLNYLVQQITRFTASLMRVLYMVDERLDALEELTLPLRPAPVGEEDLPSLEPDLDSWADLVAGKLSETKGRVLHTECAGGALVSRLTAEGVDAYGVDPRAYLLDAPVASGLDVRTESAVEHLQSVADLALSGLVLSGFIDRISPWDKRKVTRLASAKLARGGMLVIIGTTPNAWARSAPVVQADLSPGRPLHPETWVHLLDGHGFSSEIHMGVPEEGLEAIPAEHPSAATVNANLDRLNGVLFGSATFAVVSFRGR